MHFIHKMCKIMKSVNIFFTLREKLKVNPNAKHSPYFILDLIFLQRSGSTTLLKYSRISKRQFAYSQN